MTAKGPPTPPVMLSPPPHPPFFEQQEDMFPIFVQPPPPLFPPPRSPLLSPLEILETRLAFANESVFLLGRTPKQLLRDYIGEYRRIMRSMGGRHMYRRSRRNTNLYLWHDGWAWIIGPEEDVGPAPMGRGWLRAESRAATPEQVGLGQPHDGYWEGARAAFTIGDGYLGWIPAPDLRFGVGSAARAEAEAHEASELAVLDAAEDVVYVVGRTPCSLWRDWLGAYHKQRSAPLQSGRYVYAQQGHADRMLWYTDGVYWRFGVSEHLGEPRGPIKVRDPSLTPEGIHSTFEVGDGSEGAPWDMTDGTAGWLRAPDLMILRGESGRVAMEAHGLPACFDEERTRCGIPEPKCEHAHRIPK